MGTEGQRDKGSAGNGVSVGLWPRHEVGWGPAHRQWPILSEARWGHDSPNQGAPSALQPVEDRIILVR